MTKPETMTRLEAAVFLRCSPRTVDRRIPPGTPGRTDARRHPGKLTPRLVEIDRKLVEALLPAPGGEQIAG